jgi:hypothetical protein
MVGMGGKPPSGMMPGMAMPGMPKPGMAMPGMPKPGMPKPGMPMPGMSGMAKHAKPGAGAAPDLNDVTYDAFLANDRTLADPEVIKVEPGGACCCALSTARR